MHTDTTIKTPWTVALRTATAKKPRFHRGLASVGKQALARFTANAGRFHRARRRRRQAAKGTQEDGCIAHAQALRLPAAPNRRRDSRAWRWPQTPATPLRQSASRFTPNTLVEAGQKPRPPWRPAQGTPPLTRRNRTRRDSRLATREEARQDEMAGDEPCVWVERYLALPQVRSCFWFK